MGKITILTLAALISTVATVNAAAFYDIKGHWAETTINNLADKGIVSGVDTNQFAPDGTVSRAQYLKMIMEVTGIGNSEYRVGECLEVNENSWYAKYLQKALDCGLIPDEMIFSCQKNVEYTVDENGKAVSSKVIYSGMFNGDLPITREEMAVLTQFCYQYSRNVLTNKKPELLNEDKANNIEFNDEDNFSEWTKNSIKQATSYGFITGMSDGGFYPKNNATRAEAATIIERVMNY